MAGISATGMGSNLDVNGLVERLMNVERQPLTKLDKKSAAAEVKISAFGAFRGALSAFQGTLKSLADPSNYSVVKSTIDDSSIASVSASPSAAAGSFSLEVQNLAKAQKLASATTFSAVTDVVGTGTLTLQFGKYDSGTNAFTLNGDKPSQTLTIDTAHSSLQGVRDAINAAKIGVSANIVNDGSGFKLVLSAKDTGSANSVRIQVNDDDTNQTNAAGLSQLAYDPTATAGDGKNLSQIIGAEDARFLVDGLLVTKSSNVASDVVSGTTLNLLKTNTGSPTRVSVSADTTVAMNSVDAFVKAYNELNKTINDATKYNSETKIAGPLQGDAAARGIATAIRNGLSSLVSGAIGNYKALPQIGLSFDRNGNLSADTAKLSAALKTDPTAVQSLFASAGKVDDPLISYAGGTSVSHPGSYAIDVNQLATRGTLTGSAAAGLTIDATNDILNVSVNGVGGSITLNQAIYASHAALIAEVQSKINGSGALGAAGANVNLTQNAGVLTMTSARYGSSSKVSVTGGNGAENLFGTAPNAVAGLDVAGSLSGTTAIGSGQRLTAVDGLKLDVLGGSTGARGTLRYGVGIAGQLDQMLTKLLGGKGLIAARTESLKGEVKQIESDRDRMNQRLETIEKRYTAQFNALDQQLTNMQSMSASLAQQLAAIRNSE